MPSTRSDSQGNFTIQALPKRDANLEVRAEGFEPYSEILDTTKDVEKEIFLKRPQIFRVTVLDPDGRVVNGMKAVGDDEDDDQVLYRASTEGEYFSVRYPFRVYAEGILGNLGITKSERIERYQEQIVLVLESSKIKGIVTDEDGNPVTDYAISVRKVGDAGFNGRSAYGIYSQDGSFTLNNLPAGRASLSILRPFHASGGFLVGPSGPETVIEEVIVERGKTTFVRGVLKGK